jgi:hypothetical protein
MARATANVSGNNRIIMPWAWESTPGRRAEANSVSALRPSKSRDICTISRIVIARISPRHSTLGSSTPIAANNYPIEATGPELDRTSSLRGPNAIYPWTWRTRSPERLRVRCDYFFCVGVPEQYPSVSAERVPTCLSPVITWFQAGQRAIPGVSVVIALAVWRRGIFKCHLAMGPLRHFYASRCSALTTKTRSGRREGEGRFQPSKCRLAH